MGAVLRVLIATTLLTGCGDLGFVVVLDGGPVDGSVDASADDGGADAGHSDLGVPPDAGPRDAFRPSDAFRPDALAPERCDNGTDDDGDGAIDCVDSDCVADPACGPVEPESCGNTLDDDADGAIDCDDGDCAGETTCGAISEAVFDCLGGCVFEPEPLLPACHLACQVSLGVQGSRETNCTDGLDNDDDGQIDGADSDC